MQTEIVFSGFGGQGVMFVGQLLAYAAMDAGKEVTWIPSYGPEMRGGTAHCFVVISDHPIGAPVVAYPQNAVVFNKPSFTKYQELIASGGLLVVNGSLVEEKTTREDIHVLRVPATETAESLGDIRLTNMVLLGALLGTRGIIPGEVLRASLKVHIPEHRRNLLELNYTALTRGYQIADMHSVLL